MTTAKKIIQKFRIGIDLGGTKTEGIVLDTHGIELFRERRATPQVDGYDAVINNIVQLVLDLEQQAGQDCSVGIGTPGAISSVDGKLKNSNTTCLNGQPVLEDLGEKLGRVIKLQNDANCFALSEAIDGAGKDYNVVFGVIMGTGVGGGIIFNKQVHDGIQHIAGEWGHNILEPDGPECYCGRKGCVETFISGPGLERDYLSHDGQKNKTVQAILQLAENGDNTAIETMARFYDRFGRAMAVVVNILDPDAIVLGGGLSNIKQLYTTGRDRIATHVFNDELKTKILPNKHGDSSGVRGAAWL